MADGRLADGRLAVGRLAVGRLADGRLSVGRLADGRLAVGRAEGRGGSMDVTVVQIVESRRCRCQWVSLLFLLCVPNPCFRKFVH